MVTALIAAGIERTTAADTRDWVLDLLDLSGNSTIQNGSISIARDIVYIGPPASDPQTAWFHEEHEQHISVSLPARIPSGGSFTLSGQGSARYQFLSPYENPHVNQTITVSLSTVTGC